MIKIYDYVIYIRDVYRFRQICKAIDEVFNFKHQYKFDVSPTGSVTSSYTFKEEQELYNSKYWSQRPKSILSCISIYEEQKQGIKYLVYSADKYKDVYSFIDGELAEELLREYPKMNEYKDRWSWGSELVEYYDEGYSYDNPRIREINCDLLELECNECYEDFTVICSQEDIEDSEFQCPHCKNVLTVEVNWEPIYSTRKSN